LLGPSEIRGMSVMSEEVLPTTFDISFEDLLSGAIRKQKCGLHSQQHQKHKESSQRSI